MKHTWSSWSVPHMKYIGPRILPCNSGERKRSPQLVKRDQKKCIRLLATATNVLSFFGFKMVAVISHLKLVGGSRVINPIVKTRCLH